MSERPACLSHLQRLSAVRSDAGVRFLTPAATPGNHCPMHTALAFATTVPGLSTLVVGMPECTVYSRVVAARSHDATARHWSYVLDDSEVIFGCGEGLAAAIREMDRGGARAIMVIFTCVPELTGEDIEGILYGLRPQVSASLIPLPAGHFKCNSHPQGLRKALASLCALMEPQGAGAGRDESGRRDAEAYRDESDCRGAGVRRDESGRRDAGARQGATTRSVNVLGWTPDTARGELPEELQVIRNQGFHLRFLGTGTPIEGFCEAPDAVLNLVLSPWAEQLAQEMERSFAVPFCTLCDAYGIATLDEVFARITELLRLDAPLFSSKRREHAAILHQQAKDALRGTRYVCAPLGEVSPIPLALYLAELGMEPLLLHIDDFAPAQRAQAQQLNAKGYDPLVCHLVNVRQDAAALQDLDPDFCFGALPGKSPSMCLPSVGTLRTKLGYDRMIGLLELLLRAVEEKEGSANVGSSSSATTATAATAAITRQGRG